LSEKKIYFEFKEAQTDTVEELSTAILMGTDGIYRMNFLKPDEVHAQMKMQEDQLNTVVEVSKKEQSIKVFRY
jgi:hypothetical protein